MSASLNGWSWKISGMCIYSCARPRLLFVHIDEVSNNVDLLRCLSVYFNIAEGSLIELTFIEGAVIKIVLSEGPSRMTLSYCSGSI
jgi:hypothetical protein